jgi:hypothetical protein
MKRLLIIALFTICFAKTYAQQTVENTTLDDVKGGKTANKSEVLSNIFTAVTTSFGKSEDAITLKATPYGIISIFNKDWKKDANYVKYRFLRNIQLNTGLTPKDNNITKFQDGSLGLTISLVNKSDKTLADYNSLKNIYLDFVDKRTLAIKNIAQRFVADSPEQIKKQIAINASITKFFSSEDIADLDPDFASELKRVSGQQDLKTYMLSSKTEVKKLIRRVTNGSLVTLTPSVKYNFDKRLTDMLSYKLVWQFGLRNDIKKKPWQVEFTALYKTERDTLNLASNLNHTSAAGSGGINFVLAQDSKEKSTLELKPSFKYTRVFKARYPKEEANTYEANVTLRLRLSEDTWLPLTLKYDIKNPQLFGFLTIFWNMK